MMNDDDDDDDGVRFFLQGFKLHGGGVGRSVRVLFCSVLFGDEFRRDETRRNGT